MKRQAQAARDPRPRVVRWHLRIAAALACRAIFRVGLGTLVAVALVLAISYGFAHVSFGMIHRAQARLVERNREL
jgi:hypothetical protein